MKQKFLSTFSINEEVAFYPMQRHCNELGIKSQQSEGAVVAVRFTEAKVFYDIYDKYWGKVFTEVDSAKVFKTANFRKKKVKNG